jgi:hypothetical protein
MTNRTCVKGGFATPLAVIELKISSLVIRM